jgi:ribosomal protein S12 methylthiotransferase accessory factor
MSLRIDYYNSRIEILDAIYAESRAAQLHQLSRMYNRGLGPVVAVNYLRPELTDISLYSAYCHHSPLDELLKDAAIRGTPYAPAVAGGGKGTLPMGAILGALGEMAERLLGTLHWTAVAENITYGSYENLTAQGVRALSPVEYPLFATQQYERSDFEYVRWEPSTLLGWVEGTDLVDGSPVLVPAQLVLMYYKRHWREPPIGYATTAGGAFHTSRQQAILHGLYEVIERDCLNLSWYCRLPPPRVDVDLNEFALTSLSLSRSRLVTPYIERIDVFVARLDAPIPVLFAIAVDKSLHERAFLGGSGAGASRDQALTQALLEVAQGQTAFHFDNPFGRNPISADTELTEVVEFFDAPLYFGHARNLPRTYWFTNSAETVAWEDLSQGPAYDAGDELDWAVAWLRQTPLRPIVFDFGGACWPGVSITKVFVPQLSQACPPHNPMLGHPRFYELPHQLGLAPRQLRFDDLCADPVPFA